MNEKVQDGWMDGLIPSEAEMFCSVLFCSVVFSSGDELMDDRTLSVIPDQPTDLQTHQMNLCWGEVLHCALWSFHTQSQSPTSKQATRALRRDSGLRSQ